MGRKPLNKEEEREESTPNTNKSQVSDFLKKSKVKGLEMSSVLSTSLFSNIQEWVSTGSYTLNKVMSGDINKGLPRGRIMACAGPSGVGKTYLLMSSAREAQKQGYTIMVFDTENAFDAESFRRLGGNPDEVLHIPIITITELRNKCVQIMDEWMMANPKSKLFIIIDSLGNLITEKVLNDIEENKGASDMGIRAKQMREMARVFTNWVAKHQAIMFVSNHTYEQAPPNPNMAPVIKFNGGEGFVYATSGIVYLRKSAIREEEVDAQGNTTKVKKGNILKATAEKNRFVPEGLTGEIYLSFDHGLNKWYGLLNDALDANLITEPSQGWFQFTHLENKVRKKDLYKSANWVGMIDKVAEFIKNKYKYIPFAEEDELENEASKTEDSSDKEEVKG